MVIVDTNVLAYLLIDGDRTPKAQALFTADPDWRSDRFLLIEFANLLATYQRTNRLSERVATSLLADAERLVPRLVDLPNRRALHVAIRQKVSVYDARFLGVAQMLGGKLVTEDAKLRKSAPTLTCALDEALR